MLAIYSNPLLGYNERTHMFYLAFHQEDSERQVVLLRREGKSFAIQHLRTLPGSVKPLDILQPLLHGKKVEIVTGLTGQEVLLRTLSLKLKSKREIRAALPFQVENLLPYSQDELLLLPTLYPEKDGETEIFLLASGKQQLEDHLKRQEQGGIDPDIVSCIPLALFRFARHFFPESSELCHYHFGRKKSRFVLIEKGKLQWTQTQNFGTDHFIEDEASCAREIERMVAYIQKKNPEIQSLLLTGAHVGRLAPHFSRHFTLLSLKNGAHKEYALPIGLALDGGSKDSLRAQFRLPPNLSARKKETQSRFRSLFLGGCVAFSALTLFLGNLHVRQQEQKVLEALPGETKGNLSQVVTQLERSVYKSRGKKTYAVETPKVADLLGWLSTHPDLPEGSKIESLKYELADTPKLGSKGSPPSIKVELDLTISNPQAARDFHQALLKDRNWIDSKQSVRWTGDHGSYQATFFLNPRKGSVQ